MTIIETMKDGLQKVIDYVDAGGITVDDSLSADSTNPVQNKVITGEIDDIATTTASHSVDITTLKGDVEALQNVDTTINNKLAILSGTITTNRNDFDDYSSTTNTVLSGYETRIKDLEDATISTDSSLVNNDNVIGVDFGIVSSTNTTKAVTGSAVKTYVDDNALTITNGDGIGVSKNGTTVTIEADFGTVTSSNTTKPVTGATVLTAINNATPTINATTPITYTGGTISANYDTTPTSGSNNLIKSGGVYTALVNAISAGKGISISKSGTTTTINAVLPTSDPGIDNVLYIVS